MINLHESVVPGRDRNREPWISSQTRICSQRTADTLPTALRGPVCAYVICSNGPGSTIVLHWMNGGLFPVVLYVWATKAQARLHGCTGSSKCFLSLKKSNTKSLETEMCCKLFLLREANAHTLVPSLLAYTNYGCIWSLRPQETIETSSPTECVGIYVKRRLLRIRTKQLMFWHI